MINSIKGIISTLILAALVTGCGSTAPSAPVTPEEIQRNFDTLADNVGKDPTSTSYLKLFNQYLLTTQPYATNENYEKYLQVDTQIQNNTLTCGDVDWRALTRADFWSIEPHMAALECYEQDGNSVEAEQASNIVNFLLEGIINSGDGQNAWSAYEIATWADANKIVELLGYDVLDEYLHFNQQKSLVYKVFLATSPDTGFQELVWFENNRFLHTLLGIQYPFAGVNNSLFTEIKEGFGAYYSGAQIGIAKVLITDESTQKEGFELLIKAVESGSPLANLELGWACLLYDQDIYIKDNCIEFLLTAAEAGVTDAHIILALQHYEGLYSEQDSQFAEELFTSIEPLLEPGKAQHNLALRYKNLDAEKYQAQYRKHLTLAAGHHFMPAKEFLWQIKVSEFSDSDDASALWQELKKYAHQGSAYAAARYAEHVNNANDATVDEMEEAKTLLLEATKTNYPYAHYVAGRMYEKGKMAYANSLDAFLSFQQGAIRGHSASQLKVGYFNDVGRAVEVDKALAFNWYFLCSKSLNTWCLNNIGIYYREGIVVDKNPELAETFLKISSGMGNSTAEVNLGKLYDFGTGLYENKTKANEHYLSACENNNSEGCHYHGASLEDGDGISKDIEGAKKYYEKGCRLNYGLSCYRYGLMYWKGEVTEQDYTLGIQYFTQACELGNANGCMELALAYRDAIGVKKDISRGGTYRLKACRLNYKLCLQIN